MLSENDQLSLEWAGAYRHYHAAMFRTIIFGEMPALQGRMYELTHDALLAAQDALRPGQTVGDAFQAYADIIDNAGMQPYRLNACGYSLGTTFSPNWMDWPMLYANNPVEVQPGMIFFCHMNIFDDENQLAMSLGETVLTTNGPVERLSRVSLELCHRLEMML